MSLQHHVIARQLTGIPVTTTEINELPEPGRSIAQRLVGTNGNGPAVFDKALSELIPDARKRQDFYDAVFATNPTAPQDSLATPATQPSPVCPILPNEAIVHEEPARGWIDNYVEYASALSPMTPQIFHEGTGLALVSTTIARRLVLPLAHDSVYPNLFVLQIATTTLWRKSTGMNIGRRLARQTIPHLLAPQDATPEALLSDLAGHEPANKGSMSLQEQNLWEAERNFSAQRGLILDELSGLLANSSKDYNAGLLETFLRLYDCDPSYTRSTRAQGRVTIRDAYFTLLGASTPQAMAKFLNDERLWGMGWWPRFALLTPEGDRPEWKDARETEMPSSLPGRLTQLDKRLPPAVRPDPPKALTVTLGRGVFDAWSRYNRALSYDLITPSLDDRLSGTYGRLPTLAFKVAVNLAAMDWPTTLSAPCVELRHLARAIQISETWRLSAHRALQMAVAAGCNRLIARISRLMAHDEPKGVTMRNLCKSINDHKPEDIEKAVKSMISTGLAEKIDAPSGSKGGRPTERYLLVHE